jgi:molybdenum cofactor cytidylyltransferase
MSEPSTNIALVVLAAGLSHRFGPTNKLLAPIIGRPLIAHLVTALSSIETSIQPLTIVVGPDSAPLQAVITTLNLTRPVRFVINPNPNLGVGTSIACAIAAQDADVAAALFTPADLPLLTSEFITDLITTFTTNGCDTPVHAAFADGTPTSPAIWPRRFFPALAQLSGDFGGKHLLNGEHSIAVKPKDVRLLLDIDTPAELAEFAP